MKVQDNNRSANPTCIVGGKEFAITDLSMAGLRISPSEMGEFKVGAPISATITLRDGRAIPVEGRVVRIGDITIQFTRQVTDNDLRDIAHDRRRYFRLRYPHMAQHPILQLNDIDYRVIELSEGGLRFRHDNLGFLRMGDRVRALTIFRTGRTLTIEGVILRIEKLEAVIQLVRNIPEPVMVEEQRYIITHFPRA
ncbi:MAG: PilZ domain-containing protein [Armatimonadota bacterium]